MKGAVVERPKRRVWTYEDYLRLDDDKRYELINGRLEEMPAPTTEHQRILGRLYKVIDGFVEKVKAGEVFISPVDVILSETTVVQPDLLFVSKERQAIVKDRVFGPPDLVVEIISPATVRRDTVVKKDIYERFGVKDIYILTLS